MYRKGLSTYVLQKIEYQKNGISKKQNDIKWNNVKMEYQKNRISKKQNIKKQNIEKIEYYKNRIS